jgi:hypothetical protein
MSPPMTPMIVLRRRWWRGNVRSYRAVGCPHRDCDGVEEAVPLPRVPPSRNFRLRDQKIDRRGDIAWIQAPHRKPEHFPLNGRHRMSAAGEAAVTEQLSRLSLP